MNEEIEIVMSPLCQSFEKDSITLQIEIYRSQESDWMLEVVNPTNTSIVWDEAFQSDKEALEEFQRTIKTEGIQSLFWTVMVMAPHNKCIELTRIQLGTPLYCRARATHAKR